MLSWRLSGRSSGYQVETEQVLSSIRYVEKLSGLQYYEPSLQVKPLRYAEIPKAARTLDDAFEDDIFGRYVRETPDARPPNRQRRKAFSRLSFTALLTAQKRNKYFLTINGGDSLLIATPAPNSNPNPKKPDPIGRVTSAFFAFMGKLVRMTNTPEQKKRSDELTKVMNELKEAFGDQANSMIYVDGLATAPASQGHGYASTLLDAVKTIAFNQGQDVYLFCHNLNVPFYESNGFVEFAKRDIGVDNPTYNGPPISASLMQASKKFL